MKKLFALLLTAVLANSAHAFSNPRKIECNREICARRETALDYALPLGGSATAISAIILARDAHKNQGGSFRREYFPLFSGAFGLFSGFLLSSNPYRLVDGPGEVEDFSTEDEAEKFREEANAGGLRFMSAYTLLMGANFFLTHESKNRAIIAGVAAVPILYTAIRMLTFKPNQPRVGQGNSSALIVTPSLFYISDEAALGAVASLRF